eukprot:3089147-Pleurochrysis_carterae.AAC.2
MSGAMTASLRGTICVASSSGHSMQDPPSRPLRGFPIFPAIRTTAPVERGNAPRDICDACHGHPLSPHFQKKVGEDGNEQKRGKPLSKQTE